MKNILITGTSSGLGLNLAITFKENGYHVYGLSRSQTPCNIVSDIVDFSSQGAIVPKMRALVTDRDFEYVILNAGVLHPIEKTNKISIGEFERTLQVNINASKQVLDFLINNGNKIKNVIAISSGAANKPYDGWLTYCVGKAALKQLIACYAIEHPTTHFLSLAPGIIKTKMQDYIQTKNPSKFSSLKKFHDLYDSMETPDIVARKIFSNLHFFESLKSGTFFDLREISR